MQRHMSGSEVDAVVWILQQIDRGVVVGETALHHDLKSRRGLHDGTSVSLASSTDPFEPDAWASSAVTLPEGADVNSFTATSDALYRVKVRQYL